MARQHDENTMLLDDAQLQWLRQLQLPWRTLATRGIAGERRSFTGRGNEPELLRRYQYGDDVRRIDWPATLRLQRPTVRQPQAVMPGRVHVLLDTSPSMHVVSTKWAMARQICAAVGVVATAHGDSVSGMVDAHSSPWFNDANQWLSWVNQIQASPSPMQTAPAVVPCQLIVVISDLWHEEVLQSIQHLRQHCAQLMVVHTLAATEVSPEPGEEITLRDSERADEVTLTLTAQTIQKYQDALEAWCEHLRVHCLAHDVDYTRCHDAQSLVTIMNEVLQ